MRRAKGWRPGILPAAERSFAAAGAGGAQGERIGPSPPFGETELKEG